MLATLQPRTLGGTLAAIPAKADAHRRLIAAALADNPSSLCIRASSVDIDTTIACLRGLGATITQEDDQYQITPLAGIAQQPRLDCQESGSTLRFLLPVAAAVSQEASFTGCGRLPERPLDHLLDCLAAHGLTTSTRQLPFTLSGQLQPGRYQLPGHISSQYVSGLLFALPLLADDSRIELSSPLQSAGYARMTLQVIRQFGIQIEVLENGYHVFGNQRYHSPGTLQIEGDWSNAAFFLVAGVLGAGITVSGLQARSEQPDRAIYRLLQRFGAGVAETADGLRITPGSLKGQEIDVAEFPDLFPILSVLAALCAGETLLHNAARLRLKESDRIASTAALLTALGVRSEQGPDWLRIWGQNELTGGTVDSMGDHRIAMAAAIAASRANGPVTILDAGAVNKSYPGFYEDYQLLGGYCDVR